MSGVVDGESSDEFSLKLQWPSGPPALRTGRAPADPAIPWPLRPSAEGLDTGFDPLRRILEDELHRQLTTFRALQQAVANAEQPIREAIENGQAELVRSFDRLGEQLRAEAWQHSHLIQSLANTCYAELELAVNEFAARLASETAETTNVIDGFATARQREFSSLVRGHQQDFERIFTEHAQDVERLVDECQGGIEQVVDAHLTGLERAMTASTTELNGVADRRLAEYQKAAARGLDELQAASSQTFTLFSEAARDRSQELQRRIDDWSQSSGPTASERLAALASRTEETGRLLVVALVVAVGALGLGLAALLITH